jgi:hypothetical protein
VQHAAIVHVTQAASHLRQYIQHLRQCDLYTTPRDKTRVTSLKLRRNIARKAFGQAFSVHRCAASGQHATLLDAAADLRKVSQPRGRASAQQGSAP